MMTMDRFALIMNETTIISNQMWQCPNVAQQRTGHNMNRIRIRNHITDSVSQANCVE